MMSEQQDTIEALTAAVARLMHHIGVDDIRLGDGGTIVAVNEGCVSLDGVPAGDDRGWNLAGNLIDVATDADMDSVVEATWCGDRYEMILAIDVGLGVHISSDDGNNWVEADGRPCERPGFDRLSVRLVGGPRDGVMVG